MRRCPDKPLHQVQRLQTGDWRLETADCRLPAGLQLSLPAISLFVFFLSLAVCQAGFAFLLLPHPSAFLVSAAGDKRRIASLVVSQAPSSRLFDSLVTGPGRACWSRLGCLAALGPLTPLLGAGLQGTSIFRWIPGPLDINPSAPGVPGVPGPGWPLLNSPTDRGNGRELAPNVLQPLRPLAPLLDLLDIFYPLQPAPSADIFHAVELLLPTTSEHPRA